MSGLLGQYMGNAQAFAGEIGARGVLDVLRGNALELVQFAVNQLPGQADSFQLADGGGLVYDRDSISSQATTIGQLETVGLSWKLIDSELDELKRVTPQDIQDAARTYFTRERLSVAHVLPEESAHE